MKRIPSGRRLPDYDTLSHFGALNGIDSLTAILASSIACFDLGLEPVSAAATISAWGEWRGKFADGAEMGKLLADIAHRKGDGDLLAEGSRRAMEALGAPHLSMSVKSLELPAYDPRGAYGLALAFCTSNRGGCHMAAMPFSHEILRKPVPTDRFSFTGKARINKIAENALAAVDSMSLCRFAFLGATLEEFSELLTAATGMEYTPDIVGRIGERIFLTERFYNCANGFSGTDDLLPERFFREPGSDGDGVKIPPIDRLSFFDEMRRYYRIRGLTPEGTFADNYLQSQP
jgi:aldehyde:ferredoxin oxidoreductase